eukprot:TRINITY_DN47330_c0_g1_i1.p1 TRINITY_DN47330_c0_g1~~TRINITY_DN47330_c0_g1_i1.p1  ORF type:complete len:1138 (-),score=236.26 TRINITY_DN47330_c0_g1_i1:46-2979(-)
MPRCPGLPCGLMNVGNTCYVNSLLQTLFHVDEVRKELLQFRLSEESTAQEGQAHEDRSADVTSTGPALRRRHALRLASELRKLFAYCLLSERSCMNPATLLAELVDQRGHKLPVGAQEDVSEFMLTFLDQLEEGLRAGAGKGDPEDKDKGEIKHDPLHYIFTGEQVQFFSYVEQGREVDEEEQRLGKPEEQEDSIKKEAGQMMEEEEVETESECVKKGDAKHEETVPDEQTEQANEKEKAAKDGTQASDESAQETREPNLVVNEEQSDFLQIFLDVKHKDLYSAWDAANRQEVDYTTPSGSKARGSTQVWINRLPKLLFFQLQRVTFDPETKEQVKLDDHFDFDMTIYPDRYLHRNRDKVCMVDAQLRELQSQHRRLQQALQQFQRFTNEKAADDGHSDDSLFSAAKVLQNAALCLEENARLHSEGELKAQCSEADADEKQRGLSSDLRWSTHKWDSWHPNRAVCNETTAQDSEPLKAFREALDKPGEKTGPDAAVHMLRALASLCQNQEDQLSSEMARLKQDLTDANAPLQQQPYELFAIWVHEGQQADARAGHYMAYLKDLQKDRWVRFSDSHVSVVPWEEVQAAAVGGSGLERSHSQHLGKQESTGASQQTSSASSSSSAYVLVYMEASLAQAQRAAVTESEAVEAHTGTESSLIPPQLLSEIIEDNDRLRLEQGSWEDQAAQREVQHHAQAIFQHYAGLVHNWDSLKRLGDSMGNPHDPKGNKDLTDPALVCFELFLYRQGGEQEVWHSLLHESLRAQREQRGWTKEEEGQVLYFLAATLRSQECYMKMLREIPQVSPTKPLYDIEPMDLVSLKQKYDRVLETAHIMDEALALMKNDGGIALPRTIGLLVRLWARYNLDLECKWRNNEVLLLTSVLIYHTVGAVEQATSKANFRDLMDYFYLVLTCVEWPGVWKKPVMERIAAVFPKTKDFLANQVKTMLQAKANENLAHDKIPSMTSADQKQMVLQHPMTQS